MNELVTSRTVTINVGPDQSPINVSTSLFQGISEPLHQLLNSLAVAEGDVSEINKYLQYDDKDAFLELISIAFKIVLNGDVHRQPRPTLANGNGSPSKTLLNTNESLLTLVKCRDCKKGNIWLDPKCESCKAPHLQHDYGLQFFFELQLAQSHKVATVISSLQSGKIQNPNPTNNDTGKPYPLIHFAKLFNLAAKWRVEGLQYTSLQGFQNRLKRYAKTDPKEKTLEELLDVLRYLASTASAAGGIAIRRKSQEVSADMEQSLGVTLLLESLIRYICVHVSNLLSDLEFRQIVAEYGVIGLVLFEVLEETIIASRGEETESVSE